MKIVPSSERINVGNCLQEHNAITQKMRSDVFNWVLAESQVC